MDAEPKPEPKPEEQKPPKDADAYAALSRRISSLEGKGGGAKSGEEKTSVLLVVAVVGTLIASALIAVARFILHRRRKGATNG